MTSDSFAEKRKRNASGESTVSTDSGRHIPTPPDGGWGWLVVIASFVNHIIVDGISYTFSVFYLVFLDYFKESTGKTALVGSLLTGFYLLTGPFASALVNKWGCRPVCIVGSIIAAAAFMLSTLSTNVNMLMLTYGVMGGIGFGLMFLPSVISVSYYFERRRALATGFAVCGAGVGCLIFAPVGPILTEKYDWKSAMFIIAAIVLNGCVTGLIFRPLDPPKRSRPRAKNILDRMKEKAMIWKKNKNGEADEDDEPYVESVDETTQILEKVKEAKLAREEMLQDEESALDQQKNMELNGNLQNGSAAHLSNGIPTINVQSASEADVRLNDDDHDKDNETARMLQMHNAQNKTNGHIYNIDGEKKNGIRPVVHNKLLDKVKSLDRKTGPPHGSLPGGMMLHSPSCNITPMSPNEVLLLEEGDIRQKSKSTNDMFAIHPRNRNKRKKPEGVAKTDYMRPMYRKDIFYSGSIRHIPQFQSQPDVKTYLVSTTSIPAAVPPEKESCIWRCLNVPKAAKDILKEMLDLSLLKDPVFLIACLAEVAAFIGLFVPFVYMVPRAIDKGVEKNTAAFLLSVCGITNTIGRVLSGALADFKWVNSLLLHNLALIFAGLACFLNMYCTSYGFMCAFAAFFGLCVATFIALTSIILCDLMGLEKLTNAFGLLTMTRGLSCIAGPPIAGFVYDGTKNYDVSFHIGGAVLVLSGLLYCLLHLPVFKRHSDKLQEDDEVFPDLPVPPKVVVEMDNSNEKPPNGILSTKEKNVSYA